MTIGTRLFTLLNGAFIAEDEFGNRYYRKRGKAKKGQREKRWVVYKGIAEPSKVPPAWHCWLHHTTDVTPNNAPRAAHKWEKEHLPNLTGTELSYVPQGHIRRGGERAATSSDYEPWKP